MVEHTESIKEKLLKNEEEEENIKQHALDQKVDDDSLGSELSAWGTSNA